MPTKARRYSVRDNERYIDGSMHLIQCNGIGPDGKDCIAWTSIWLPNCCEKLIELQVIAV